MRSFLFFTNFYVDTLFMLSASDFLYLDVNILTIFNPPLSFLILNLPYDEFLLDYSLEDLVDHRQIYTHIVFPQFLELCFCRSSIWNAMNNMIYHEYDVRFEEICRNDPWNIQLHQISYFPYLKPLDSFS